MISQRSFRALALILACAVSLGAAGAPLSDDSWLHFETGKRLFSERRFGEALNTWKLAVETRKTRFAQARARLESALADREASRAKGSIRELISIFAKRDIIERDYAAIKAKAGGSLRKEAELLKERRLADGFTGFLDTLTLVLDYRPASAIGDSLESLRSATAELAVYPEAEYWIGRVYLVEGELRLAELQFKRAYDMRESLEIPEDAFAILSSLAGIYKAAERWREYEETLAAIADSSTLFSEKERFLRDAMERSLAADGFDKFMVLYRVDDRSGHGANAELGEFLLRHGRPQALIRLASAANAMLTLAIARIRDAEPSYVYSSLEEILGRIERDRELSRFADESRLYPCLYYLGESLSVQGYRESARGIWRALSRNKAAGPWSRSAGAALVRAPGAPSPFSSGSSMSPRP